MGNTCPQQPSRGDLAGTATAPPHQWTAAAEPIAKKPNKNIEITLELGNPTPGRINSDLKIVYKYYY